MDLLVSSQSVSLSVWQGTHSHTVTADSLTKSYTKQKLKVLVFINNQDQGGGREAAGVRGDGRRWRGRKREKQKKDISRKVQKKKNGDFFFFFWKWGTQYLKKSLGDVFSPSECVHCMIHCQRRRCHPPLPIIILEQSGCAQTSGPKHRTHSHHCRLCTGKSPLHDAPDKEPP